jgi:hypothetical protein
MASLNLSGNAVKPQATGINKPPDIEQKEPSGTEKKEGSLVGDVASSMAQKAEDAASGLGSRMESLAGTLREKAPQEGMMGRASSAVADTLQAGGHYLAEQGASGAAKDVTDLVRKHPIPAVLIGIGLGFLLARVTIRS